MPDNYPPLSSLSPGVVDRRGQPLSAMLGDYVRGQLTREKLRSVAAHPLMSQIERANALNAQQAGPPQQTPLGDALGMQNLPAVTAADSSLNPTSVNSVNPAAAAPTGGPAPLLTPEELLQANRVSSQLVRPRPRYGAYPPVSSDVRSPDPSQLQPAVAVGIRG